MTQVLIRHKVKDFGIWKQVYDSAASLRQEYGCLGAEVLHGPDNEVVVQHSWDDIKRAQAFVGSSDLRVAMGHAGVVGQPEIMFLQSIEKTDF